MMSSLSSSLTDNMDTCPSTHDAHVEHGSAETPTSRVEANQSTR